MAPSPPPLSPRLEGVLGFLRPSAVLADVGTDHALLPIAAVCRGVAVRAIAADLREAPLARARAHVARLGVGDRVETRRADGLSGMHACGVDAVVIAGMSAGSAIRILEAGTGVLAGVRQLIVQPNQGVAELRAWALRRGWWLRAERMIEDRGRCFVVCAFTPGSGDDPAYAVPGWSRDALCEVGPGLLARRDAVARCWFERQRARVARWVVRDVERLTPQLAVLEAACHALRESRDGAGERPLFRG